MKIKTRRYPTGMVSRHSRKTFFAIEKMSHEHKKTSLSQLGIRLITQIHEGSTPRQEIKQLNNGD